MSPHGLAPDAPARDQIEQRIMNPHVQARVQLRVGPAGLGLLDQTLHGDLERSIARETDPLVLPQAVPVELRNVAERVEAAGMAIAGEAPQDGQTPEDAHARGGLERSREGGQVGDGLALEQAGESMAGWFWSEHRRLLGGLIQLGLQAPPKS